MPTDPAPDVCACCTFGNHTERCTCDGTGCCHPENHLRPATPRAPQPPTDGGAS